MIGLIIMAIGCAKAASDYGILQAFAFAGLWFVFGIFMLGIPSIVGMLRTLGTFEAKELIQGLLAQLLLIAILFGALSLIGIQSMFSWFIIGGIIIGLTAPQQALNRDREDRIKLNQEQDTEK